MLNFNLFVSSQNISKNKPTNVNVFDLNFRPNTLTFVKPTNVNVNVSDLNFRPNTLTFVYILRRMKYYFINSF
jgi:hypothetical protein